MYDQKAATYREGRWIDNYIFGILRLRHQLLRNARGRILDVACGTGESLMVLPEDSMIRAIDLSPRMLAETKIYALEVPPL